jgi:hypothetical protein
MEFAQDGNTIIKDGNCCIGTAYHGVLALGQVRAAA